MQEKWSENLYDELFEGGLEKSSYHEFLCGRERRNGSFYDEYGLS